MPRHTSSLRPKARNSAAAHLDRNVQRDRRRVRLAKKSAKTAARA